MNSHPITISTPRRQSVGPKVLGMPLCPSSPKAVPRRSKSTAFPVASEIAKARKAYREYQSTRKRDAIYRYLDAVFEIVSRWKREHRVNKCILSAHCLIGQRSPPPIRAREPFSVLIYVTSNPDQVDKKARSKWSKVLQYAEAVKPEAMSIAKFVKGKGGINACAAQASARRSSRRIWPTEL